MHLMPTADLAATSGCTRRRALIGGEVSGVIDQKSRDRVQRRQPRRNYSLKAMRSVSRDGETQRISLFSKNMVATFKV
jgi:hypothetical protein